MECLQYVGLILKVKYEVHDIQSSSTKVYRQQSEELKLNFSFQVGDIKLENKKHEMSQHTNVKSLTWILHVMSWYLKSPGDPFINMD